MSATVAPRGNPVSMGNQKRVFADVTFDNSYPTGGEAIEPVQFGLSSIAEIIPVGPSTNGYHAKGDPANLKVLMFRTDQVDDPGEQVPNTTDLSAETVRLEIVGR